MRRSSVASSVAPQPVKGANQITEGRRQLVAHAAEAFTTEAERRESPIDGNALHAKSGATSAGVGLVGQRARTRPRAERKTMIDRTHRLSVTRQAMLLARPRASVYYTARPVPDDDLTIMRRIDELQLELPVAGICRESDAARSVAQRRRRDRSGAGAHADAAHGRHGDLPSPEVPEDDAAAPHAPGGPLSLAHAHDHAPNHVWAADLTYLPMARGFVYLVVIMD